MFMFKNQIDVARAARECTGLELASTGQHVRVDSARADRTAKNRRRAFSLARKTLKVVHQKRSSGGRPWLLF